MKVSPASVAATSLATLALAVAVASIWWPFQSDHGVYAWMADVVRGGGMPYRDAWDVKGPTALLPAFVAQAIFGRNMWGVRALDVLVLGTAAVGMYRLTSQWLGQLGASLAACFWILLYMHGGFGNTAQPDGFWGLLLFVSMVPLLRAEQPTRTALLLAGACVGCLCLLKPFYGAFLLLPVLAVRRDHALSRSVVVIVAGFLLTVGAILAWLSMGGALGDFADAYIRFNAAKNSGSFVSGFLVTLSDGVLADPVWLTLVGAGAAGFVLLRSRDARIARVLGAWVVIAFILVHVQRPFYLYRTHVMSAPIVVLAAFVAGQAAAGRGAGRHLAIAVTAALSLAVARPSMRDVARWAWHIPGPGNADSFLASHAFLSTTAAGERRLIDLVARLSAAGDSVYAFRHPSVYFLADRPAASRISILAAVGADAPQAFVTSHLAELGRALEATHPKVIALPDTGGAAACLGCFDPLARLPAAAAALAPHYRLLQRADGFAVFVRGDPAVVAP